MPEHKATQQSRFTPAEDELLALGVGRRAPCAASELPEVVQPWGCRDALRLSVAVGPHLPAC